MSDDDSAMISTDIVYLLTHNSKTQATHSLPVYDADEIPENTVETILENISSVKRMQRNSREVLEIVEETRFGFGIVFRLAGLCDSARLVYHEILSVNGSQYSGYSEIMGTFGRLDHVEKAFYYCPREAMFAAGSRSTFASNCYIEICIRTESGVQLFKRTWEIIVRPLDELEKIELGEVTIKTAICGTPSPVKRLSSPPPRYSETDTISSAESLACNSFIDIEKVELTDSEDSPARFSQSTLSVPRPSVIKQMGLWLYGSKIGQYMAKSFDISDSARIPKSSFAPLPIWLLGTKYELKPTEIPSFKPSQLVPRKSESSFIVVRSPFKFNDMLQRRGYHMCSVVQASVIIGSLVSFLGKYPLWNLDEICENELIIRNEDCCIRFKTVFQDDGLILESIVECTFPGTPTVSLYADILRYMGLERHIIMPVPLVKEWSRTSLNMPNTERDHVVVPWKSEMADFDSSELILFWDSFSLEWIEAKLCLSTLDTIKIFTPTFTALDREISTMQLQNSDKLISLTSVEGDEYHLFISDIQRRLVLSSKLYLATGTQNGRVQLPLSQSAAMRNSQELIRAQTAMERHLEIERRHISNKNLIQEFLIDFESRFWFTYRREMPRIANTMITTDAGWACLLRCGQMMLAEAFARILLGRGWNHIHLDCGGISPHTYQQIIGLFEDKFLSTAPFGLHALVAAGTVYGHPVGQWFSPSLLAKVCSDQSRKIYPTHFVVIPVENGILSIGYLRSLVAAHPILLMVPLRLGVETFNMYYIDLLTGSMEMPYSVGILGGKPGKAFHIVGHQEQKELFYLDPHVTKGPPPSLPECMVTREYHSCEVLSMEPADLDPSLMFGFLIRSSHELEAFMSALGQLNLRSPVYSFMP